MPEAESAPGQSVAIINAQILRERAELLARDPRASDAPADTLLVVEFLLAREHYAIEMAYVREVYPLRDLTPLPGTPPFIMGIINVRGQIVTVIDAKVFFDLPRQGITELNRVVIVQNEEMEIGILADAIVGVQMVPRHEIQLALPTLTGIRAEYLRGVTLQPLVVLDVAALLADEAILVADDEAAS